MFKLSCKSILIVLMVVVVIMTTGCDKSVNYNKGNEEIEDNYVQYTHKLYKDTDLEGKYEILKLAEVITFEIEDFSEEVDANVAFSAATRITGFDAVDIDYRGEPISIRSFVNDLVNIIGYDLDMEESMRFADSRGMTRSVNTEDVLKNLTYESMINILYESLYVELGNVKGPLGEYISDIGLDDTHNIAPVEVIAANTSGGIVEIMHKETMDKEDIVLSDGKSPVEGDMFVEINKEFSDKILSIINTNLNYYEIVYEGRGTNIQLKGIKEATIDMDDNLIRVTIDIIINGSRGSELIAFIEVIERGDEIDLQVFSSNILRVQLGSSVISKNGNYLNSDTSSENIYRLVDSKGEIVESYEISHNSLTNKIVVNQIDN